MENVIIVICLIAASISLLVIFSIKGKILPILGLRLCFSALLIAILAFFGIVPFNAINVASTGLLGAPGLVAVFVIARFL